MRKIFTAALILFIAGTAVFAQEYSDTPPIETYIGFQFNIDLRFGEYNAWNEEKEIIEKKAYDPLMIPSVILGARQYWWALGNSGLEAGYVVLLSAGFLSEMDWMGIKIESKDADLLLNAGALIGVSLRGDIADGLGIVADLGVAGNLDSATYRWYARKADGSYDQSKKVEWELNTFNFGVGLNAALQYRIPLAEKMQFILELGAGMGLYFVQEPSVKIDGKEYTGYTKPSDPRLRIGPYLMAGVNF